MHDLGNPNMGIMSRKFRKMSGGGNFTVQLELSQSLAPILVTEVAHSNIAWNDKCGLMA